MTSTIRSGILLLCVFIIAACQPKAEQQSMEMQNTQQQEEVAAAGMVFTGEMKGQPFTIATGNEYDLFMEVHSAFNNMDTEAIWQHSADTIEFHMSNGQVTSLTRNTMNQMFAELDSVSWQLRAVIPVQVEGSDRVNILVDSWETVYPKEGEMNNKQLFERFVFENDKITAVYQWDAKAEGN